MKKLICILALLVSLAGSVLFSKGEEKVQVVKRETSYPSIADSTAYALEDHGLQSILNPKGLNYDSLPMRVVFITVPSVTPQISNFNKFIYEDTILAENVAKILDETAIRNAEAIGLLSTSLAHEVGVRADALLETLVRRKEIEAKAYLSWPILTVLSLALLTISTAIERRLLQYISGALLVAAIVGSLIYLPDILIYLSADKYGVYDLLINR